MPRTAEGRPLSYIAVNGHGSYPRAGFIPRIFLAFNDRTGKGVYHTPSELYMCVDIHSLTFVKFALCYS